MKKRPVLKRGLSALLALTLVLTALTLAAPQKAQAANFLFITDIRLEAGAEGFDKLEEAGYSVMTVGLNSGAGQTKIRAAPSTWRAESSAWRAAPSKTAGLWTTPAAPSA